jgi:DNA/RNA-binding domain of Phe-tRNA-synthetase-like protein
MAELNSLLLTAGHDLDQAQGLISLDTSTGEEVYTLLRNEEVTCKSGDMVMSDQQGVFCSVIYGQLHLKDLEQNVNLAFLQAKTTHQDIYHASPASD